MKKNKSVILLVGVTSLLFSLGGCSKENSEDLIAKLVVDSSNVKSYYFLNDKLDLSTLSVKLKVFKNNEWVDGDVISDYTSSISNGSSLTKLGDNDITITYKDYSPYTFTVRVLDKDIYKVNSDFSQGSSVYIDQNGETKNLNMSTFGINNGTPYLDPLSTSQKVLVVPYYFTEQEDLATEENRKILEDTFFGSEETANEHNQPYSVKSYYEESSFNKTSFNGNVIPRIKSSYGSDKNITNGGIDACQDIRTIYEREYKKENHGVLGNEAEPLSYYDGNKDGVIDFMWIIYSREMDHVSTNQWWAYTSHEGSSLPTSVSSPVPRTISWASFSFLNGAYDPHTYVHETGHAYGLMDYYCYNASWSPMGKVDMMDNNIGDHNAFSKYTLGWSNPLVVNDRSIIKLHPFTTSGESIILPSQNYNNTAFDEYLILEYDGPYGLSKKDYTNGYSGLTGFTDDGIRVMHVDGRVYKDERFLPLTSNIEEGHDFSVDNSKFGRNSGNNPSRCTTDYYEGINNPSSLDRSYSLINTIPASYEKERNLLTTNMKVDNSSLFKKGSILNFNESYYEFLPSYSSLWNKSRTHIKDQSGEFNEVSIDDSVKINYSIEILDIKDQEATILIDVL